MRKPDRFRAHPLVRPNADEEPASGIYANRLSLHGVPRLALSPAALRGLPLDARAGFIVWLIDGVARVEDILDSCAMSRDEAIRILEHLVDCGVVAVA